MIDIVSVTYGHDENLKCFINSIKSQTNNNWRLFIIHDGPNNNLKNDLLVNGYLVKNKVVFVEHPNRVNDYGHTLRKWGLNNLVTSEYVLITNCDNYYTPTFIDEVSKRTEDFIYFDCIHSHKTQNNHNKTDYGYLNAKLSRGWIDIGSAVIKSDIAKKVGFNSSEFHADWIYFENVLKISVNTFKINKILFVHN
jgi:GT2 family glycosyltransferase